MRPRIWCLVLALTGLLVVVPNLLAQEQATRTGTVASDSTAPVESDEDAKDLACDPAYVGVCIPPPPPDLDCADVPERGFRVVGADPHRLDRDRDGIACEGVIKSGVSK